MTVFRVEKTKDYTVMSNYHFRNKMLSLKAKGLLSLMLSLPEEWDYTLTGLSKLSTDGIDSIKSAVKELEDNKYLIRKQTKDINGKFSGNEYQVYENPVMEKPLAGNPLAGNPLQLNTNIINKLNNKTCSSSESIYEFIEQGFGRTLNPIEYQAISEWEDTELTRYAITQAVLNNKYSIKYIQGILHNFKINNIKTIAQAEETNFKKSNNKTKAIVPSWLGKEIETKEEYVLTDEEREFYGIEE